MEILLKLFLTFLKIGLVSIGGGYAVIPSIHEEVVVKAGWIGEKVFADIITISQMTPGPLAVNTSTFVGLQIAGAAGAVVATVGCVFCGVAVAPHHPRLQLSGIFSTRNHFALAQRTCR